MSPQRKNIRFSVCAQSGFSLLELIIVVSIIGVLMVAFTDRVWYYQEMAEKTAMQENLDAIQTALTMQYGKQYVHSNPDGINRLFTENPIKWLQKPPRNYAGEFFDPKPNSVPPGSWMFDLKSHELIYVVDRADHFVPGKDGGKWVHFHVTLQYEQREDGGVKAPNKELVGMLYEPTEQLSWL